MNPNTSGEHSSTHDDTQPLEAAVDRPGGGIIGALLEVLNGSETYQLVHRGGEFFLEPALKM